MTTIAAVNYFGLFRGPYCGTVVHKCRPAEPCQMSKRYATCINMKGDVGLGLPSRPTRQCQLTIYMEIRRHSSVKCLMANTSYRKSDGPPLRGVLTPRVRIRTYDVILPEYIRALLFGWNIYIRHAVLLKYIRAIYFAWIYNYVRCCSAGIYKSDAGTGDPWEWWPQTIERDFLLMFVGHLYLMFILWLNVTCFRSAMAGCCVQKLRSHLLHGICGRTHRTSFSTTSSRYVIRPVSI